MNNLRQKNSNLLIIFIKNPVVGEVKTSLANTIGDFNAFKIYIDLLFHTHLNVKGLPCDKAVFYSDYIDTSDLWENDIFFKSRQFGDTPGERMQTAFHFSLMSGYDKVVLISGDVIKLKDLTLKESFDQLESNDVVIGPSGNGGYYLIGMKQMQNELFEEITWTRQDICNQTISKCENKGLSYAQLIMLSRLKTIDDFRFLDPADRFRYMQMIKQDNFKNRIKQSHQFFTV